MIRFTKYNKIYLIIAGITLLLSFYFIIFWGLKPGIDFTGGTILEIEYKDKRPSNQEIEEKLKKFNLGSISIQPTEEKGVIIKTKEISDDVHNEILSVLGKDDGIIEEKRFEFIGPVIGKELTEKTFIVVVLSLIAMMIYISLAFRKMKKPIKSWQYSLSSVFCLFHDTLIVLAVFSILGKIYGVEISIPIITALITLVGYSINNTVVVFDRMRENISFGGSFDEIIDKSLNETLLRQFGTSFTTLVAVLSIFFFGGTTLKYFSLTLVIGLIVGSFSSFFIAAPLLLEWLRLKERKKS
ncbi:MAG TPA: protein translocase subunit SecF [Candidatus Pacearchaeota archaeon]|nr:protein translocase subunit SecF [Candidatus Pacearchaeota archaeon]HPO68509.1 protein translocase subunit SecF [Candidatus Pacearchaeota archaeon]